MLGNFYDFKWIVVVVVIVMVDDGWRPPDDEWTRYNDYCDVH